MAANLNVNTSGVVGANGAAVQGTVSDYRGMVNIVQEKIDAILKEAAEIVLKEAKLNIHNDTGALEESGRVVLEKISKGTRAEILFGGEEFPVTPTRNTRGGVNGDGVVDYAFFVHEGISPSGRGASSGVKFLERAVITTKSQVKDLIANKLKSAIKSQNKRRK